MAGSIRLRGLLTWQVGAQEGALSLECLEASIDQRRAGKKYGEPGCLVFGGVVVSTGVTAKLLSPETRKWTTQGPNEDFGIRRSA